MTQRSNYLPGSTGRDFDSTVKFIAQQEKNTVNNPAQPAKNNVNILELCQIFSTCNFIVSVVIEGVDIPENEKPTNCACFRSYIRHMLDFFAIVKNSVLPCLRSPAINL